MAAACDLVGGSNVPSITMPSRAEHGSRYFPITAPSAHDQQSCDDCHGGFDTFRKFDCVTCHAGTPADAAALAGQPTHSTDPLFPDLANPDHATTSGACMLCHADGTAIGIDHSTKFPIGAASQHATAKCGDCHVSTTDRKVLGCAGCHPHEQAAMTTAHAGVQGGAEGYEFTSAKCVRCHADSEVKTVASHLPFSIVTGNHNGTDAACLKCHPDFRADKPFGANFNAANCVTCHARAHHLTQTCYAAGCHPDGRSNGN
jgi:hypothetical protein